MTVILDGYSRKIVSHVVSNTLKSQETSLKALEKGLLYGVPETIHSDRGLQFVCNDWEEALENFNINSSYSQKGTPTENGKIERVFRSDWEKDRFIQSKKTTPITKLFYTK